jgi:hypothetical protein
MSNQDNVCFTFDAACDAAIEMETRIYQDFLHAIRIVNDKAAVEILQDSAAVRLGIKHKLELAALKGGIDEQKATKPVPIMNLDKSIRCCDLHHINGKADNRKALAYSIQRFKNALEFYRDMTSQCSGAPMAQLFKALGDIQTKDLQRLEDTYEEHFLTEG